MKKIRFLFKKNDEIIIDESNINVTIDDKLLFNINNETYSLNNDSLIKENNENIITIDFNNKNVDIFIKDINKHLIVKLLKLNIEKKGELIKIEYIIETEEDITNIIKIEYI